MRLVTVSALCLTLLTCSAAASAVFHNSNSIKLSPAAATASPDVQQPVNGGEQNLVTNTEQPLVCTADSQCARDEFCVFSRGVCFQCRKSRKHCFRNAMCCPGNHCTNGVCQATDPYLILQKGVEKLGPVNTLREENATVVQQSRVTTQGAPQNIKALEGELCLRSSDCMEGLCCARHFWSRICKPVLKEGQVCTKHKRKGPHNLELFQRCNCGEGLSCRMQKGDHNKASRSLHICQRH